MLRTSLEGVHILITLTTNIGNIRGSRGIDFDLTEGAWRRTDLQELYQHLLVCNHGTELENKTRNFRIKALLYGS